jgi:hypothetical protein
LTNRSGTNEAGVVIQPTRIFTGRLGKRRMYRRGCKHHDQKEAKPNDAQQKSSGGH